MLVTVETEDALAHDGRAVTQVRRAAWIMRAVHEGVIEFLVTQDQPGGLPDIADTHDAFALRLQLRHQLLEIRNVVRAEIDFGISVSDRLVGHRSHGHLRGGSLPGAVQSRRRIPRCAGLCALVRSVVRSKGRGRPRSLSARASAALPCATTARGVRRDNAADRLPRLRSPPAAAGCPRTPTPPAR